jgi:hypothetical protein
MPAVMRAAAIIERAGVPTVAVGSAHFEVLGHTTADVMGVTHVPIVSYPGVPLSDTSEEFDRKVTEIVAPAVVGALTGQPAGTGPAEESPARKDRSFTEVAAPAVVGALTGQPAGTGPAEESPARKDRSFTEVVFRGSLDQVHDYFLDRSWTDGLPIVPPTRDRVEAFLRHSDRRPDEVLGVLPPARQEATVWNVAVNGVMAGCAPAYLPVLLAAVECIADPVFRLEEAGSTPGWEPMVILSGPLARALDFNAGTAVLRIGRRANSSVGRFLRLYMRNVAGLLPPPGTTDQGAIAGNFYVALAEDDEFVRSELAWPTYREDHGFRLEDTVVGVQSVMSAGVPIYSGGDSAEAEMWAIARCFADTIGLWGVAGAHGNAYYPLLVMGPSVARSLKDFGWTKGRIREHLWESLWMRVEDAERYGYGLGGASRPLAEVWEHDRAALAKHFRFGPEPMVRMLPKPELIQIVVAGNPGRNQSKAFVQQNRQGPPVTRQVRVSGG